MIKKTLSALLCLCLCAAVGCAAKTENLSVDNGDEPEAPKVEQTEVAKKSVNPLTGISDVSESKVGDRPVAIMVNNIATAQGVQSGLDQADIVYETEVEGGITRLLAVFQDVSKVEKVGSIRSARYPYVDLAAGHNAIYIHCGQDPTYCAPHLKDVDDISISESNYGTRVKNGLSSEHTMYTFGERLWKGLVSDGWKTNNSSSANWQSFADEKSPISYGNSAQTINVPFSTSYKTTMKYDESLGKYTRYFNGTERKDYTSGNTQNFKNVFVLLTTIKNYPDGKHRQVYLTSGSGYYCVNGTYTKINWAKGNTKDSFKFSNEDGSALTVNPGNSWVCIADKSTSKPVID